MQSAQLVLALLIAVAALVTIARRLGIAYPIFLVIGGLLLGLVPGLPRVEIDPDLIFLLVLPPLLYAAAFFTPLRSLRANLGPIASLAVGLVVASAFAAAAVTHTLIPGVPWAVALALGAIVAPPDEIAATAIAARLAVPRRIVTILEGESLLNDATALTIYAIAITAAVGGPFKTSTGIATFARAMLGGTAIGLAVGWIIAQVRARIEDTPVEITISLLTPYAAFLPAQQLGVSGVIATVAAGLYLGRRSSRIAGPDARLTGRAVWETISFLLNGVVFIITGLEVPLLLRALAPATALRLVGIGVVVSVVLVVVRALWIFPTELLAPLARGEPRPPRRLAHALVLSWAGMRGVVSLAVALALPLTLPAGGPFPAREALLIVTLTVIVFTLLGQGLSLPWLIRRLRLGTDPEAREEEASARQQMIEAATRRIDQLYPVWPGHHPLLDRLRDTYQHRSEHVERQRDAAGSGEEDREIIEHREIQRTVIDSEREALLRLRADGTIDDDVLRALERELDLEDRRIDA
ncbi:MAG: Na+/H+ antiporter [Candidatus Rokuibacteriota bacterium]